MANLTLVSPLRGWCGPLDETPDAVFAQRLLGDGVAIDPTGDTLYAPCDGEVVSVAASMHAVAIRALCGAEILLHVGIDTVALAARRCRALVAAGTRVRTGDLLLSFDLDERARGAKSLMTPIVITNGDRFTVARVLCDRVVDVGDLLMELESSETETVARADDAA